MWAANSTTLAKITVLFYIYMVAVSQEGRL